MADIVKEMLTRVGMLKLVTGRKAFLLKTDSRTVGYMPSWEDPEQLLMKVLLLPVEDIECVRRGREISCCLYERAL